MAGRFRSSSVIFSESLFPVLHGIAEPQFLSAGRRRTEQVDEVTLPGDKTDDGNLTSRILALHEVDEFLDFLVDELRVSGAAREPEYEFIKEEHDGVVSKRLGVAGDDLQTLVERQESLCVALGMRGVLRKIGSLECRDELRSGVAAGGGLHRIF